MVHITMAGHLLLAVALAGKILLFIVFIDKRLFVAKS